MKIFEKQAGQILHIDLFLKTELKNVDVKVVASQKCIVTSFMLAKNAEISKRDFGKSQIGEFPFALAPSNF